jgi:hypothetical protein
VEGFKQLDARPVILEEMGRHSVNGDGQPLFIVDKLRPAKSAAKSRTTTEIVTDVAGGGSGDWARDSASRSIEIGRRHQHVANRPACALHAG